MALGDVTAVAARLRAWWQGSGWTPVQTVGPSALGPTPMLAQGRLQPLAPLVKADYWPGEGMAQDGSGAATDHTRYAYPEATGWTDGQAMLRSAPPPSPRRDLAVSTQTQYASAYPWQSTAYPPGYRELLRQALLPDIRDIRNTQAARPLAEADYFLGYRMQPGQAGSYPGGSMPPLGM